MELEGPDAANYLKGHGTVRDGKLVSLSVKGLGTEPVIRLAFEIPCETGTRCVELELRDILEFDYGYSRENPPGVIELVKCLMSDSGEFYLSLDPYDEREAFASEKDNEIFRSKFVKLTVHNA